MTKLENVPTCPAPPPSRSSTRMTTEYRISLVTPLFGGGVEPGVVDESMPIRATSIRGHLRFWWRATRGHDLGELMWQREEEIFGSTEFSSPLTVSLLTQPKVERVDPSYGDRFGPIAYALFSAVENRQQVVREEATFRVQIAWQREEELNSRRNAQNEQRKRDKKETLPNAIEDISCDIAAAFEAWCAYGGLGSRTRRGCGSLFCREVTRGLPKLPGRVFLASPESNNALEAWKAAVRVYREFRQSFRGKKHRKILKSGKTANVPGRSHWPEADSIRKITGSALKSPESSLRQGSAGIGDHSIPVVPEAVLPAFPRALLGLPINFHFADGPGKNQPGKPNKDPQDVQLAPPGPDGQEGLGRMASPVITRPLWLDGKWCPGVIVLERSIPSGLRVRLTGKRARSDGADLSCDVSSERIISPSFGVLEPMLKRSSALDALCDFLTAKGFREVML